MHYVCTGGCGGEADRPGTCQAEDCSKEGQPMVPCACEDGLHDESSLVSEDDGKGDDEAM